jgi:digeranylgeranylglycerophospholipid reductase
MNYELIIIGAGPAGATAAKIAAEGGANVCILEAEEEGRYKCCAGGIPVTNRLFTPIPRNVGEREITGGVVVTPINEPMEFETTGEKDKGYCMFRTDFDKFLVNIAHDAGAEVKYKFRVKGLHISRNNKVIIKGPQEYKSKCVILANGLGGAILQRKLGLEVPPMVSAIQAEFSASESFIDEKFGNKVWEFFDRNIIDHGIAWAFPKREAVSIGVLGKGIKMSHFRAFLNNPIIKEKIKERKMMEFAGRKVWAAPIPDHIISKPYCDSVMIVGDACGTADPILYEGIYQARLSGKLAAEVFLQALTKGDFGELSLMKYHTFLMKQLYEENLKYTYKFHHLLFHSGLLEDIINASFLMAQKDPEMMRSMIALFSGTQTRKKIWKTMMDRKLKLSKQLGIIRSLKLIPPLFKALRI